MFDFAWPISPPPRRRTVESKSYSWQRAPIPPGHHILEEAGFLKILYLERRRSERSGRPLCLILLDGSAIIGSERRETAFQLVFDILHVSIRETDTIGWYKEKRTFAVLFSEIAGIDKQSVNTLREKVTSGVTAAIDPSLAARMRVSVHVFPSASDQTVGLSDFTLYPDLPHQDGSRSLGPLIKRAIDIVGSSTALLFLSPLFVLIALAIRLTSVGPVVFRQKRMGQYGTPFIFLKFRSMYVDSNALVHKEYVTELISGGLQTKSNGVYKITNDPRMTPLGRLLRKTSLDELPQFWNVLRGEMSLVGPRPPVPYEFDCYAPWHRRRILEAKPGITGLWQVTGRSRTTFNDMVRLDLKYVKEWSIWLDIKILLQTPRAVVSAEGAY
jgi:exopolysaccharide biosynthesis polyprenyl glycosylphosphotransferase